MNYILSMSLSGSCLYLLYRLIRVCLGGRLKERWYYIILKIAALYFLVPLPWLKVIYQKVAYLFRGTENSSLGVYYCSDEWILFQGGNGWLLNHAARNQIIILVAWLGGVGLGIIFLLFYYFKQKKALLVNSVNMTDIQEKPFIDDITAEAKIIGQVEFRLCKGTGTPFATGLLKPVIFYQLQEEEEDQMLLVRHELIHIKRRDMLWQFISMLVLLMHWYNPLAWLFKQELESVCESSCDEAVLSGQPERVRADYAKLLIYYASRERKANFGLHLSKEGKSVSKRIVRILSRTKKLPRLAGALLIVILVVINSLTVLAYEELHIQKYIEEIDAEWLEADIGFIGNCETSLSF